MSSIKITRGDRIVVVVGPSGAGKSTFIACAADLPKDDRSIGHKQKSFTSECHAIRRDHPSSQRSTVLIDTPGFNDTDGDDIIVLGKIGDYLAETCRRSCTVPIIVYLHRIQDNRMAGSVMKGLNHLRIISSPRLKSNVVLVTTFWSELARKDIGTQREQELKNDYWRDLLEMGCKYGRFRDSNESAWEIINTVTVQDSLQEANKMQGRFVIAQEQERRREILEEAQRKTLSSRILRFFGIMY